MKVLSIRPLALHSRLASRYFVLMLIGILAEAIVPPLHAQTADWRAVRRGNRYFGQQRYAEAEAEYLKASQMKPKDSRINFNLGDVYLGQNNMEAAAKQFDHVIRNSTNKRIKAKAYHNLGYMQQTAALQQAEAGKKQQQLKEAIAHYQNALRNNPEDDGTRYNLALCKKLLKDSQQKDKENKDDKSKSNPQDPSQQKQEQSPQSQKQEKQQPNPQTRQLMNLSRQSERRTREKINAEPQKAQRSAGKNW